MRRVLALALLCTSLALIAATPPPPAVVPTTSPHPSLSPLPAALPSPGAVPTIVVFPFDVNTGADPKLGIAIAQISSQEMAAAGGVSMLAVPENVKRPDFLQYAQSQHADFYISGYVTSVGSTAAVVEQVVSVESGVILFSQTAQVSSVADVASQSLAARSQILIFVGRGTQNISAQSNGTPAPTSTNGAQMQIKGISGIAGIVDSVFHHGKGGPTPTPSPLVKPDRGIIVAAVTGTMPAADLANASHELFFALSKRYNATLTGVAGAVDKNADAICGTNRNNTIATGTLGQTAPKKGKPETVFTMQIYTCFGAVLDSEKGQGANMKAAVDAAVTAYAANHPDNS